MTVGNYSRLLAGPSVTGTIERCDTAPMFGGSSSSCKRPRFDGEHGEPKGSTRVEGVTSECSRANVVGCGSRSWGYRGFFRWRGRP